MTRLPYVPLINGTTGNLVPGTSQDHEVPLFSAIVKAQFSLQYLTLERTPTI